MIKKFFLFLTIILTALWMQFSLATERQMACWVVGVSDGDTLTCLLPTKKQFKVRLQEIDAPEKGQPFGKKAKQYLSQLVFKQNVTCQFRVMIATNVFWQRFIYKNKTST